ncbi:YgjV family protein [Candidatus Gracilibacteria bacterium]|nr:YgjV family protein [Candidatus Gracilibacteria bacterium]
MIQFLEHIPISTIAQIVGFIAMSIAIFGYLQNDDTKVKKIFMCSTSVWIIHFLLMGMYSAVAACFMGLVRIFLSLKYQRNKRIFYGVVAGTLTLGFMTMENHMSLLPIIGSCISAYGFFFYERVKLRMFMMVSSLLWLTFNIHIESFWGIINDLIIQSILILTMLKMLHEEHKRTFFVDKVFKILDKRHDIRLPDVGRYISMIDFVGGTKKWTYKMLQYYKNVSEKFFRKKVKEVKEVKQGLEDMKTDVTKTEKTS